MRDSVLAAAIATISVCFATVTAAFAESFNYNSEMQVRLGETWNPLSPFSKASLSSCFLSTVPTSPPPFEDRTSESFVSEFSELATKAAVEITASGSTSFGVSKIKADASLETLKESFRDNRSVVYSVSITRTYGNFSITNAVLNDFGQERLAVANEKTNPELFYKRCGRSLVTSINSETTLSVLYLFRASSASNRDKVRAAISAAVSSGLSNAEGSLNILNEARSADSTTEMEVLIYQNGQRDSTDAVSDIVGNNPGDLVRARAAIRAGIGAIKFENSPIKKFSADPISNFFDIAPEPSWQYVSRAYSSLEVIQRQADRFIDRYLDLELVQVDVSNGLMDYRENGEIQLISEKNLLLQRLSELSTLARSCFRDANQECSTVEVPVASGVLKYVEVDFGSSLGWRARAYGHGYNANQERVYRSNAYWPLFQIGNLRLIRSVKLVRNGNVKSALNRDALLEAVKGGILNFQGIFESTHSANSYCWRGDWTGCDNWAANTQGHMNELKAREAKFNYELVVEDIEGNILSIPSPNPTQTTY